ncbi:MAG: putative asparaginase, partial [Actinomyces urogenitalis DORA_12]
MRVHVTYTGGTIGMIDSPHGLVPGADLEGWLGTLLGESASGQ